MNILTEQWRVWKEKHKQDQNEENSSKLEHEIPGNVCPRGLVYYIGMMTLCFSFVEVVLTWDVFILFIVRILNVSSPS